MLVLTVFGPLDPSSTYVVVASLSAPSVCLRENGGCMQSLSAAVLGLSRAALA
jgi:hypothetical protein